MSYLTYDVEFQNKVIEYKISGMNVKDICSKCNISVYTLYKILHMNGKMPIPSEASEGKGSEERVEHRNLSPNNNSFQECPTSTWKGYISTRHRKIEHICINCNKVFMARDRGNRTKFCSRLCKSQHRTLVNSTIKICDNCGKEFKIKRSCSKSYIHCKECRGKNLGRVSSKRSRQLGVWLSKYFIVESEKQFDWLYDINKSKGRYKLDYYLPKHNLAIEYDGEQHFKHSFTSKWESVDKVHKRDILKNNLCEQNGVKLIRFNYLEILTEEYVLMKIYAELQEIKLVEVEDKKLLR